MVRLWPRRSNQISTAERRTTGLEKQRISRLRRLTPRACWQYSVVLISALVNSRAEGVTDVRHSNKRVRRGKCPLPSPQDEWHGTASIWPGSEVYVLDVCEQPSTAARRICHSTARITRRMAKTLSENTVERISLETRLTRAIPRDTINVLAALSVISTAGST